MSRFCTECGAKLKDGAAFCSECGTKVPAANQPAPSNETQAPTQPTQPPASSAPTAQQTPPQTTYQPRQTYAAPVYAPPAVQPIGTAYYFWMLLVFMIPIVGLIVCLVTAFSGDDVSRKNFSRAVLIWIIIGIVLSIIAAIAAAVIGSSVAGAIMDSFGGYM